MRCSTGARLVFANNQVGVHITAAICDNSNIIPKEYGDQGITNSSLRYGHWSAKRYPVLRRLASGSRYSIRPPPTAHALLDCQIVAELGKNIGQYHPSGRLGM